MNAETNALSWFEIPAKDLDRAKTFYEAIFQIRMELMDMGPLKMAMFPGEPGSDKVYGALIAHEMYQPSETAGPLLYLNGNPDLSAALSRVEAAGGKVIQPKTQINEEVGYMALFLDTEGNRMALHSSS
jgi:hypothetical protein